MNRSILKAAAFVVGGGALGFAYYHFIGCSSGHCPITSNPVISTAYGALVGLVAAGGWKSAKDGQPKPGLPEQAPGDRG